MTEREFVCRVVLEALSQGGAMVMHEVVDQAKQVYAYIKEHTQDDRPRAYAVYNGRGDHPPAA